MTTATTPVAAAPSPVRMVPMCDVFANPDQPRQHFDGTALRELADAIEEQGLMQPIVVTPREMPSDTVGEVRMGYMIVAGERRFRAHRLLGRTEIEARVEGVLTDRDVMLRAIVENAARRDVSPLEEAVAYQRCLDMGLTIEELAKRLGLQQAWRVTERTCLLKLRPEYQTLLRGKSLSNSQAYEMAQLSPGGQDALFRCIKAGDCATYDALRNAAIQIKEAEHQSFFDLDAPPPVSEADRRRARSFEKRLTGVAALLRASTVNNEIVALRQVNPGKATAAADLIAVMREDLARLETALRSHAVTPSMV
jgi:ParB family chromosome partitioning protein